jgi:hypothetical protein
VLTLACLVCFEQPRFRRLERFDGRRAGQPVGGALRK